MQQRTVPGRRTPPGQTESDRAARGTAPPVRDMVPPEPVDAGPRGWYYNRLGYGRYYDRFAYGSSGKFFAAINFLLGLWLIVSPWVYGYYHGFGDATAAMWNSVILGIIIAVVALLRLAGGPSGRSWSGLNALLGIWVFVSPWVFNYTFNQGGAWNSWILGAIVFVFGLIAASMPAAPAATV